MLLRDYPKYGDIVGVLIRVCLAIALTKAIVKDLTDELGKVKWMGGDEGWDKAIDAVKKELKSRYGT